MRLTLTIDPSLIIWGAPDEVVAERCSICGAAFAEDAVPLHMWTSEGWAARLCDACTEKHVAVEKEKR